MPDELAINYPQEWFNNEDSMDASEILIALQDINNTDPIPEMYYKNGVRVDMLNATPLNGSRTVLNIPRNHRYFWKQVALQRPQMFSLFNRAEVIAGRAPIVDEQWVKYNPTHKAYMGGALDHHHEGQGRYAYAIPRKVHQKWTAILHQYKTTGKIGNLGGRLNSIGGFLQVFSLLTDIQTGNPDAWVNWFGAHDEIGKLYKEPSDLFYFEITSQTITKNSAGKVIRAIVNYDAYDDYIWDEDEKRYMGVLKIGSYTEDIDVINKTSTGGTFIRR